MQKETNTIQNILSRVFLNLSDDSSSKQVLSVSSSLFVFSFMMFKGLEWVADSFELSL